MSANTASASDYGNIIPLDRAGTVQTSREQSGGKTASPALHAAASKTTPRLPRFHLRHAGRTWRIFKRAPGEAAPWYLYWEHQKQRFGPYSLHTSNRKLAEAEARLKIDLFLAGRLDTLRQSLVRPGAAVVASSTVRELLDVVPHLAIRAAPKARRQYIQCLRRVLARSFPGDDPDTLPLSKLTADTGRAYFVAALHDIAALPTQAEQNRAKRTALITYHTASALLTPVAIESMRQDHGLSVPDLGPWREAIRTGRALLQPGRDSGFQPPEDQILLNTIREWLRIARTPGYVIPGNTRGAGPLNDHARRNLFIALGLMLSCGLRASEVPKVKWGWWKQFQGIPHLSELSVSVKSGTNQIHVVPIDPFWQLLNREIDRCGWRGRSDILCLTYRDKTTVRHNGLSYTVGGPSEATELPFLQASLWLRGLGWRTQKTNHALRDWGASLITMKYGLDAAMHWCRHSQISTTQRHYNRFTSLAGTIRPVLKVQWAN